MPPSEASAPGSIGKKRPLSRRCSLSCLRVTPGSTTQSRSSASTAVTAFMREQVERDAAVRRVDMALERRADAERNDRRVVPGAELDEVDHVVPGFGEHHRVRRLVLEPGQRVPVRLADRLGGGEAIAEAGGEIGIERGDRLARETAFALADGELGHGALRLSLAGAKIRRARPAWLLASKRERRLRLADAHHPEGQELALLLAHRHVLADLEGVVAEAEAFLLLLRPCFPPSIRTPRSSRRGRRRDGRGGRASTARRPRSGGRNIRRDAASRLRGRCGRRRSRERRNHSRAGSTRRGIPSNARRSASPCAARRDLARPSTVLLFPRPVRRAVEPSTPISDRAGETASRPPLAGARVRRARAPAPRPGRRRRTSWRARSGRRGA